MHAHAMLSAPQSAIDVKLNFRKDLDNFYSTIIVYVFSTTPGINIRYGQCAHRVCY